MDHSMFDPIRYPQTYAAEHGDGHCPVSRMRLSWKTGAASGGITVHGTSIDQQARRLRNALAGAPSLVNARTDTLAPDSDTTATRTSMSITGGTSFSWSNWEAHAQGDCDEAGGMLSIVARLRTLPAVAPAVAGAVDAALSAQPDEWGERSATFTTGDFPFELRLSVERSHRGITPMPWPGTPSGLPSLREEPRTMTTNRATRTTSAPAKVAVLAFRHGTDAGVLTVTARSASMATWAMRNTLLDPDFDWRPSTQELRATALAGSITWTRPSFDLAGYAATTTAHSWRVRLAATLAAVREALEGGASLVDSAVRRLELGEGQAAVFTLGGIAFTLRVIDAPGTDQPVDPRARLLRAWLAAQRSAAIGPFGGPAAPYAGSGPAAIDPEDLWRVLRTAVGEQPDGMIAALTWVTPDGSGEVYAHHVQAALALADLAQVAGHELGSVDVRAMQTGATDTLPTVAWASSDVVGGGEVRLDADGASPEQLADELDRVQAAFLAARRAFGRKATRLLAGRGRSCLLERDGVRFDLSLRPGPVLVLSPEALAELITTMNAAEPVLGSTPLPSLEAWVAEIRWRSGVYSGTLRGEGEGRDGALRAVAAVLVAVPCPDAVATTPGGVEVRAPRFPDDATATVTWPAGTSGRGSVSVTAVAWGTALGAGLDVVREAAPALSDLIAGSATTVEADGITFTLSAERTGR